MLPLALSGERVRKDITDYCSIFDGFSACRPLRGQLRSPSLSVELILHCFVSTNRSWSSPTSLPTTDQAAHRIDASTARVDEIQDLAADDPQIGPWVRWFEPWEHTAMSLIGLLARLLRKMVGLDLGGLTTF